MLVNKRSVCKDNTLLDGYTYLTACKYVHTIPVAVTVLTGSHCLFTKVMMYVGMSSSDGTKVLLLGMSSSDGTNVLLSYNCVSFKCISDRPLLMLYESKRCRLEGGETMYRFWHPLIHCPEVEAYTCFFRLRIPRVHFQCSITMGVKKRRMA